MAALRRLGIARIVMLIGDNEATARDVADAAGVDEWHAGQLPQGKVTATQKPASRYGPVVMVGDGVYTTPRSWWRRRSPPRVLFMLLLPFAPTACFGVECRVVVVEVRASPVP